MNSVLKGLGQNALPISLVANAQHFTTLIINHQSLTIIGTTSKASLQPDSCTTRYKGKKIAKPITPPSESTSEEDNDPEQA
ncbi:hypothetical protein Tco_0324928 [Tanacetum coccineum]